MSIETQNLTTMGALRRLLRRIHWLSHSIAAAFPDFMHTSAMSMTVSQ